MNRIAKLDTLMSVIYHFGDRCVYHTPIITPLMPYWSVEIRGTDIIVRNTEMPRLYRDECHHLRTATNPILYQASNLPESK
jgi:hypothetical protein